MSSLPLWERKDHSFIRKLFIHFRESALGFGPPHGNAGLRVREPHSRTSEHGVLGRQSTASQDVRARRPAQVRFSRLRSRCFPPTGSCFCRVGTPQGCQRRLREVRDRNTFAKKGRSSLSYENPFSERQRVHRRRKRFIHS